MLNELLHKLAGPSLARTAQPLARRGVGADALTLIGFVLGVAAIPAIARHAYLIGLALIVLNRLFDALDGAVARQTRVTGPGAFLDMTLDLIVFAGIPFAFALADPPRALAAAFLIFAIAASGSSGIFIAGLAARQGTPATVALGYLGRLMEDTELTVALAVACIVPGWFSVIAYVVGALCFITAGARIAAAVARFGE
ncbi:MAG TPA: CDP-alcohol phosphatidyltransferase family protein [Rhizomicrobium sp.]|nr:CDP-alcohol phosphatidyltransferase family protein [Rhizomicrobium sp.]